MRANADTPEDARRARAFGAEGIGLCRTEHMFMAAERQPKMQRMIMADDEAARRAALDELQPLQQADFEGLLAAMAGLPVTIRLLDPPLHEFMPDRFELVERLAEARADGADATALERSLERVQSLAEGNPMLGTRGVRLGLVHPEIYEMQVRAIFRAAALVRERGHEPARLEIMVPLVAYAGELEQCRALIERVAAEEGFPRDGFEIGSMIELPRACLRAGELAASADFFSFGTNDLTQTAIGFSRDDIEGRIVPHYVDSGILDRSPFGTIDALGVGELVSIAVERGRAARPDIELGICGEHGGDPGSIRFFHATGLDYVSCSPYRVPIARVAAAQAAIDAKGVTLHARQATGPRPRRRVRRAGERVPAPHATRREGRHPPGQRPRALRLPAQQHLRAVRERPCVAARRPAQAAGPPAHQLRARQRRRGRP